MTDNIKEAPIASTMAPEINNNMMDDASPISSPCRAAPDDSSERCGGGGGPDNSGPSGPAHMMRDDRAAFAMAMACDEHDMDIEAANFSHSPSMEFNLMREEYAAILEQGVEEKCGYHLADFDDEGRRLEASESCASLTELENEAVAAAAAGEGEEQLDTINWLHRSSGEGKNLGDTVDESSSHDLSTSYVSCVASHQLHTQTGKYNISATSSNENISMPVIAEDSSIFIPPSTLLMICAEPKKSSPSEESEYFIEASSSSPRSAPELQLSEDFDPNAAARSVSHNRSASFDRRVSESAQFAEAVGEKSDTLLLRKIIEEDSSSDFDDDDIDQGGELLHEESAVGEDILADYDGGLQNSVHEQPGDVAVEQPVGEPSEEKKVEPTCVSTDLAKMSLKGEECTNQPISQQRGESAQVPTTLDPASANSGPSTPAPSPYKPNSMMQRLCPPSASPRYIDWKFTRQHSSNSILDGSNTPHNKSGILATSSGEADFVYRGIRANPPEITKRGMARGNYAQLHRKAWLEVSDKHHRYGKNLRMYYKHWEALGHPTRMFFDWLDSKGEAMGSPLPNLPEIPRPVLDSDTVLYITNPEISANYALDILVDPADGSAVILDQNGNPINTSKEGWIFVLRDHVLYGSQKVIDPNKSPAAEVSNGESAAASKSRERFHHSSFFGGKAVASAGIFITNEHGRLTRLYPHSGHYRPGEAHMQRALFFFQQLGVELSTFSVDMQQLIKISRQKAPKGGDTAATGGKSKVNKEKDKENNAAIENGKPSKANEQGKNHAPTPLNMKKAKKTDCLHLMCGLEVACYLTHKALMIEKGVFHQIHKIRRIPKESRNNVRYILNVVNNNN